MDSSRAEDEFERNRLHQKIEKDRLIISQYENGLAHRRQEIEKSMYDLGTLDERLEGTR